MAEVTGSWSSSPTGSDWDVLHEQNAVWEALRQKQLQTEAMEEKLRTE
jgi:hypothetical protein